MGYFDEIMSKAAHRASLQFGIYNEGDYYEPFEDYQLLHCGKCHCKKEWIRFVGKYTHDELEQMKEEYARKHPGLSFDEVNKAVLSIMPPKHKRHDIGKVGVPCQCQKDVIDGKARSERDDATKRRVKENKYRCFPSVRMQNMYFDQYQENKHIKASKKYLSQFSVHYREGKGLVLCGKAGAGKTIASICLANALLDRQFSVIFKVQQEITYTAIEQRNQLLTDIIGCNVFILDDFNLSIASENDRKMLYYIIDARAKAEKPTIITSNITKDGIEHPQNPMDKVLLDRIIEKSYIVEDSTHNYRRD